MRNAPKRYRISIRAENNPLSAKVYFDFMYIEEAPVLHMVDDATQFSGAHFLILLTPRSVGETILTFGHLYILDCQNQ